MRCYFKAICCILAAAVFTLQLASTESNTTRGLKVVAVDPASNAQG